MLIKVLQVELVQEMAPMLEVQEAVVVEIQKHQVVLMVALDKDGLLILGKQ